MLDEVTFVEGTKGDYLFICLFEWRRIQGGGVFLRSKVD